MSFHGASNDQREDVALAAVLADQGRGQPESSPGLEIGRHPEHRGGEQVHLVVDDQAPVSGVEQVEVGVYAAALGGHHLVGRDGDRPDLLLGPGVLADLLGRQRRPLDQLIAPLPGRHRVGDQDQRRRLGPRHGRRSDDGFPCSTRENDDTGTAVPERGSGLILVRPQLPAGLVKINCVRLAVHVTGQILGRPAELQQHLLEVPALTGVHDHRVLVDPRPHQPLDLGAPQHLGQHRPVGRHQDQAVGRVLLDPQPAVTVHRVGDVHQQCRRHRVAAVREQRVDHLLGIVTRSPRVPQSQRGQPIGVDVLRCSLQLGERCDRDPARVRRLMIDFKQQGSVGLHDERPGTIE